MIDFYDLARSGTAPEASKSKSNQVSGTTFSARPKTRSVDNDVLDFNIDLRTNKPSYQKQNAEDNEDFYDGGEFGRNEDLLQQAIESFQADLEDWSGRKDFDATASNAHSRQQAASSARRGSGRKATHSSAVSAYTQNVPHIVLQTSRTKPKSQASSPRAQKEPKADVKADIRAVYGADILDKYTPSLRPKSQKPHSQTNAGAGKPAADEPPPGAQSKDQDAFDLYAHEHLEPPTSKESQRSSTAGATRSTSASRLRANVSSGSNPSSGVPGATSVVGSGSTRDQGNAIAQKPFSVRKAAPSSALSAGQPTRQALVPRPFSHTDRPTTTTSGVRPGAALDTPTSSSSSKRIVRKAPTNAANPLLKSSLAPQRLADGSYQGYGDIDSDHTGDSSLHVPEEHEYGTDRRVNAGRGQSAMEAFVKERASTAGAAKAKAGYGSNGGSGGPGSPRSFSQSAGTAGTGLSGTNKAAGAGGGDSSPGGRPLSLSSGSGKSLRVRDMLNGGAGRGYSRSPTTLTEGIGMPRPDSDAALVDFIQDSDIMEESFDESPILAAYLQQKSHVAHNKPPIQASHHVVHVSPQAQQPSQQQGDGGEGRPDGAVRPQSRKLYLGADKDSHASDSPAGKKSYKTAPRSAGARYAAPDSPAALAQDNASGPGGLRKMSSYSELLPAAKKWNEPVNQLPDLRPPSRQSSAFPVHLADEPPTSAATAGSSGVRPIDTSNTVVMSKNPKVASPSNRAAPGSGVPVPTPSKASSMCWSRDGHDDDVEEEDIPVEGDSSRHKDCEVESYPASEVDTPRGMRPSIVAGLVSSGVNSVRTSLSAATIGSDLASAGGYGMVSAATGTAAVTGGSANVVPTREHISIVRPHAHSEDSIVEGIPLQRPPSRQKFAAPQHLFEGGMPPPSRVGTEKESVRRSTSASPSQHVEDGPSSRSITVRAVTLNYNPRDDGFADLEVGEEPFAIKLNNPCVSDRTASMEELEALHEQHRQHRRSYNALQSSGQTGAPSHSRSSSNASNQWDNGQVEPEGVLSPLGFRPQTVAHSGSTTGTGRAQRLLGAYAGGGGSSGNNGYASSLSPPLPTQPRGKSANDVARPQAGGSARREANNFLMMNQQPHAPSQQPPTSHSRSSAYTVRETKVASEYTAGPAGGRGQSIGGWTDADPVRGGRSQNAKDYENTSERYGLGLAPASSSHALSSANMQLRLGQRSPGRDSDESDDDITIMTEDSGRHNMEGGMSMHSLALDSSLGEDFLSLFAPGP